MDSSLRQTYVYMKQSHKPPAELSEKKTSADRLSDLSRRLMESDRDAFRELFEELHVTLIRFCWRYTKDDDASRDIVQDAFVKVWEKRTTLDPSRSLLAFMYTIVRNRALNLSRDARHTNGMDAVDTSIDQAMEPDEQVGFKMLDQKIREWIDNLPPRRRQAFLLSRFEGLTHAEIATVMDVHPRTVNTHVMLALRELRLKLRALQQEQIAHEEYGS